MSHRRPDKPIIESLLDIDFYKFTMGQAAHALHPEVPVEYTFVDRSNSRPEVFIAEEQLREELDHVRSLGFTRSELHYLRGTNEYQDRMFGEDYLDFLAELKLPEYELEIDETSFRLVFRGKWREAIYWETLALAIVNELYYRGLVTGGFTRFEKDALRAEGILRLKSKIKDLVLNPEIKFSDFGTRRRFSREWQDYVVGVLKDELPENFLGTSNTYLAMKYNLLPMGTSAHEMFMVYSGIYHGSDDEIRNSHNRVLQDWWSQYRQGLSIALTDTYGTEFFFRDMRRHQAQAWKGLRQDSGDPIQFGENAIRFYESYGIDPRKKLIIFSDGLDVATMIELFNQFDGRIKVSFGWGTNLTNDLGPRAASFVIKVTQANGHGTVKLSDNIAKAIGAPEDVERFKRIFDYTSTLNEACRY